MMFYDEFITIYALVVVIRTLWRRVQKRLNRVFSLVCIYAAVARHKGKTEQKAG